MISRETWKVNMSNSMNFIVPADGLALLGTRASADIVNALLNKEQNHHIE